MHTRKEKQHLVNRVQRMGGQLEAVGRALDNDVGCAAVLQQATVCHGALNRLISEVAAGEYP
ncbi:MAG: metal/formaldehyde-sensitive transcriptional repressor [Rhodospirillales bacterium]|nr:metal/formaldehyde-sensitive transcriptional repressor [Rhodospirillales bacterium]